MGLTGEGLLLPLALPPLILVPVSTIKALGLSILPGDGEGIMTTLPGVLTARCRHSLRL